jgi:hypothetical protein
VDSTDADAPTCADPVVDRYATTLMSDLRNADVVAVTLCPASPDVAVLDQTRTAVPEAMLSVTSVQPEGGVTAVALSLVVR